MKLFPLSDAPGFVGEIPAYAGMFCMPESHTPLAYTPMLSRLDPPQRLTYNRLHTLFFHEQIIFFEQCLAIPALRALEADSRLPSSLREGLATFIREEREHSAMFSALLRRLDPQGYENGRFRFVLASPAMRTSLAAMANRPRIFPMGILMLMMQEERSLHHGAAVLREALSLDPAVVATHRIHLADEVGHVRLDEAILTAILPGINPVLMRLNLALLACITEAFFIVPRRGSVRVIEALVHAHPELAPLRADLIAALARLGDSREWRFASQSWEITPKTFLWFSRLPEVALLKRVFPGYTPRL